MTVLNAEFETTQLLKTSDITLKKMVLLKLIGLKHKYRKHSI